MAAAALIERADPEALRDRQPRGVRLLPALPRRDRGPQGHARLLHDAGRGRHGRADPDAAARQAAARRDGALHLRPSARLPDLQRQRRLRIADPGRRRRPARRALRLRRREPPQGADRRLQPLFHLRILEMHRLLALRARLRGGAGHVRADDPGPRLRLARSRRAASTSVARNASPAAPACRPARPRRSTKRA